MADAYFCVFHEASCLACINTPPSRVQVLLNQLCPGIGHPPSLIMIKFAGPLLRKKGLGILPHGRFTVTETYQKKNTIVIFHHGILTFNQFIPLSLFFFSSFCLPAFVGITVRIIFFLYILSGFWH